MRTTKPLFVAGLLVVVALGAYASRGAWRPYLEDLGRPAIPVAVPYQPAEPSTPVTAPTTPRPNNPTSTVPIKQPVVPTKPSGTASSTVPKIDPFLFEGTRPAEANLAVPFMLQAPKQNWDMPYQEACEEASLLMVQGFLAGKTADFTPDESDRLILDLVAYETSQGDPPDVTLGRIGDIARARYGFQPVIQAVTNIDSLKNAIANGYPVIVPASGKALKNPNFRNGGPPYHMVVMKGYLSDGRVVTNDPGTRKGKDYLYGASLFFDAIHDWNDGDVPNGQKIVLVLMPQ